MVAASFNIYCTFMQSEHAYASTLYNILESLRSQIVYLDGFSGNCKESSRLKWYYNYNITSI